MFMLQFWSVPLERTKIGIGSRAPQSVNPAIYLFSTELLFIVMELSNSRHYNSLTCLHLFATQPQTLCVFVTTVLEEFYHRNTSSTTTHFWTLGGSYFQIEASHNELLLAGTCQSLTSAHNKSYLFKHSCFLLTVCL